MEWFGFGRQLSSASVEAWGGLDSCCTFCGVRHIVQGPMRPTNALLPVWLQTIWGDTDAEQWHGLGCGVLSREIQVCTQFGCCQGDHWSVPSALALRLAQFLLFLKKAPSVFERLTEKADCGSISSSFPLSSGVQNSSPSSMAFFHDLWSTNHWRIPLSHFLNPTANLLPLFFFLFIIQSSNNQTDGGGSGGCIHQ